MYQNIKFAALDYLYTGSIVLRKRNELSKFVVVNKPNNKKQLLVDVSVIVFADARTGIQRVVRALLKSLIENPPIGYDVLPVFASANYSYRYAPKNFSLRGNFNLNAASYKKVVTVSGGDIFLGLDLAAHVIPKYLNQFMDWKRNGVKIHILVYDLLPVLNPEWFHSKATRNFYRWLHTIAIVADSAICISKSVQTDLKLWLVDKYAFASSTLLVNVIPMGCDIEASSPSKGLPKNAADLLIQFKSRTTALMVGTLEPRKGHANVLDAFEHLWRNGSDANLLIVGKPGWKTEKLQNRIVSHVKLNKNLFWLDDVSDEFLEKIYPACYGLILASEGEGFGLPLAEALRHSKPILARDLPVFREIETSQISFFKYLNNNPTIFFEVIKEWLNCNQNNNKPTQMHSWSESGDQLKSLILNF